MNITATILIILIGLGIGVITQFGEVSKCKDYQNVSGKPTQYSVSGCFVQSATGGKVLLNQLRQQ